MTEIKNKEIMELKDLFPDIYKSVTTCKSLETESEKRKVFKGIVQLLVDKSICKIDGSTLKWRDNSLNYLIEILPLLDKQDILLVRKDKDLFYKRFCFCQTRKKQSLYTVLQKKGPEFLDSLRITLDEIYDLYTTESGLSPYELVEDEITLSEFMERLDEFNDREEPIPLD